MGGGLCPCYMSNSRIPHIACLSCGSGQSNINISKAHIQLKNEMIMYMANAKILRWGPNANCISLIRVGGLHLGKRKFYVSTTQIFASSFALQWNIGLKI